MKTASTPPHPVLKLAIVARQDEPRIAAASRQVEDVLRATPGIEVVKAGKVGESCDWSHAVELVLVLGGDGSILRTCRMLGHHQKPIIGVNLGRLGFLAEVLPQDVQALAPDLVSRRYTVSNHLMFECQLLRPGEPPRSWLGLNEVAIQTGPALRMLDVQLRVDDEIVTTYSCDGLIVSTPVGSTGHSLAAGGPILQQTLQAFVITPICPHALTNRPVVDTADSTYELQLASSAAGATLVIDGQIKEPIDRSDRVVVRKADVCFQLARLRQHSYYGTLRRKLGWGGQPHYGS
jgi:NAD+ kinase